MHTYGGLAAPLAALAVLALAAFLGGYYALVCAFFWHLRLSHQALSAIVFAALWLLAELARGVLWTGFPWGAGGYAHVDGPLAVLARSVGVYGVGFVAAALAMALAQISALTSEQWRAPSMRRPLRRGALTLLALAPVWAALVRQQHCALEGCGAQPLRAEGLQVALLQGDIPQDEKFEPGSGVPQALRWYGEELRKAGDDAGAMLVVAPETAIPLLPQQLAPGYLDDITRPYTSADEALPHKALLIGMPLGDAVRGYTNSVRGYAAGRALPYQYDKRHLVPFGEFIPPFFKWFTRMMDIPLGDFNRGAAGQPPFVWYGQRIAPNICYEDLFGEEIAVGFRDAASAPTLLVNLSNIGWFGDSVAIDQHLSISRMRALEFERPIVRATNTGATAVIDHRGRVTHRLPAQTTGVLHAWVPNGSGAITPYAWWVSRWGLAPLWALALGVAALAGLRKRHVRRYTMPQ
jgi:apolipoprotein N-acyltransferase